MAQTRFTTYKATVESFPLGLQHIGLIKPGRYNGYDVMESTSGLNIRLTHSGQIRKTLVDGTADNNFGALVMPTGMVIHDNDNVVLAVSSNQGNSNIRYDYVICEHNYQQVQGGTLATYSIIQGPTDGNQPSLTDGKKQIILGVIEVAANGDSYADLTYKVATTPLPGDMDPADLFEYINSLVTQIVAGNSGETNTASNVGTGVSLFKEKTGEDLIFRKLKSPDSSIGITESSSGEEVELKVQPINDIINVTGSLTLTAEHNGKILRFTQLATAVTLTIPVDLPLGFAVAFFQDNANAPTNDGITPYIFGVPNLTIVADTVKVNALGGRNKLMGPGYMGYIQNIGIINRFTLQGDLTI